MFFSKLEPPRFLPLGDGSLTIEFGNEVSEEINDRVYELYRLLKEEKWKEIRDLIPTYRSLTICFDPGCISMRRMREKLEKALRRQSVRKKQGASREESRTVEIPVCYGGAFGPDLQTVADHAGFEPEEIIRRHSGVDYRIYMLGFLPGFAYLGGMDPALQTPRLASPRLSIPAGSVGIAGGQTGIYPMESPGGWQLIGRTPVQVYDPGRQTPVIYRAGDRIRFVPITEEEFAAAERSILQEKLGGSENFDEQKQRDQRRTAASVEAGIRILDSGALTSIQDEGRYGYRDQGVPVAGAMDHLSMRQANLLVGNAQNEPLLEATLLGPRIEICRDTIYAITGADMGASQNGKPVENYHAYPAKKGDILQLKAAKDGIRSYIAFAGGFALSKEMGSCAADVKAKLGGLVTEDDHGQGTRIKSGDAIPLKKAVQGLPNMYKRYLSDEDRQRYSTCPQKTKQTYKIRTLAGPQADMFSQEELEKFYHTIYTISSKSDRMGYRLQGEKIRPRKTADIISDGIAFGSVQITSEGLPILMMADHQTTGGYAKPATVITADLPRLAQLGPGAQIHFEEVSIEEAEKARKQLEQELRSFRREIS